MFYQWLHTDIDLPHYLFTDINLVMTYQYVRGFY